MIKGFTECVAIVSDAEAVASGWAELSGWRLQPATPLCPALCDAWGLANVTGREVRVLPLAGDKGGIRLVELWGCEQADIRPNPQPWDCGGLLDLNLRVTDMAERQQAFRRAGWRGPGNPVAWRFGDKLVSEWLTLGPDGLAMALIERLDPPLPEADLPQPISHAFNSSQVVADMEASLDFYEQLLGMRKFLHIRQPLLQEPGENPLGIPYNLISELDVEIAILSPGEALDGSVELICMHGLEGRNCATNSRPPNLGLLGLRFPVEDADQFALGMEEAGQALAFAPREIEMAPFGRVRMLGLQAPEGAWLEFYQRL